LGNCPIVPIGRAESLKIGVDVGAASPKEPRTPLHRLSVPATRPDASCRSNNSCPKPAFRSRPDRHRPAGRLKEVDAANHRHRAGKLPSSRVPPHHADLRCKGFRKTYRAPGRGAGGLLRKGGSPTLSGLARPLAQARPAAEDSGTSYPLYAAYPRGNRRSHRCHASISYTVTLLYQPYLWRNLQI
jgi:hypothetical protein